MSVSVWFSHNFVLWLVSTQCLFPFRRELPNHLARTHFQDATQLFIGAILQMSLINRLRWGGIFSHVSCSIIARAATPNASFGSFWSWSKNILVRWIEN